MIKEATDGWGADYVVEAVGRQETLEQRRRAWRRRAGSSRWWACSSSRRPINAPRMLAKNVTLTIGMGDLGRIQELVDLIAAGRLDLTPLITHRMPLDDVIAAYEIFEKRTDGAIKILLTTVRTKGTNSGDTSNWKRACASWRRRSRTCRRRVQVTEDVNEIKEVQWTVPERAHGHRVGHLRRAASPRTRWWTSTCTTR